MIFMMKNIKTGGSLKPGFLQKTGIGDVRIIRIKDINDENNDSFAGPRKSLYGNILRQQTLRFRKSLIDLGMERSCILMADMGLHKSA